MPSKNNLETIALKKEINILNKKIDDQIPLQEIKNITIQEKKDQPYGLIDLIAGKTPTFSGWTNNPTDAADITDGNITTFCTTGNKVCGAGYQHAYIEWDLGSFYNVLAGGVLSVGTTAGSGRSYVYGWDGSSWISGYQILSVGSVLVASHAVPMLCSKIRISIIATVAATITPNIREFHVWRLH